MNVKPSVVHFFCNYRLSESKVTILATYLIIASLGTGGSLFAHWGLLALQVLIVFRKLLRNYIP